MNILVLSLVFHADLELVSSWGSVSRCGPQSYQCVLHRLWKWGECYVWQHKASLWEHRCCTTICELYLHSIIHYYYILIFWWCHCHAIAKAAFLCLTGFAVLCCWGKASDRKLDRRMHYCCKAVNCWKDSHFHSVGYRGWWSSACCRCSSKHSW